MNEFKEYQHVERFGNREVDGIEFGKCYVFPKIDGTNGSVWLDGNQLQAGSRNRHLTFENDNAGFLKAMSENQNIIKFLTDNPNLRLYGEWLVPHSLKTYRETAWRKFYVFDVVKDYEHLEYDYYKLLLEDYGIDYIPAIAVVENGTIDTFRKVIEENTYLIDEGKGIGEGIVIKNYGFKNRYGRTTWAKIVTSEFKDKNCAAFGAKKIKGTTETENRIISDYCTEAFIRKEHAKLAIDGWDNKMIPKLLGIVFNRLIVENLWDIVKGYKYPAVDFGLLAKLSNQRVKEVMPELF